MGERIWKILTLVFLIWAIATTTLYVSATLGQEQESQKAEAITVNLGIKVKEGPIEWKNGTVVPKGATLLEATVSVFEVNYTVYKGIGAFVNSIEGIENEKPYYWMWWYWAGEQGWILGPVAADKYVLSDGETVLWYYQDTSKWPPEKP